MEKSKLGLSICIATRNRPDELIKCLDSLVLLKDYPYEVIVIDDGSDIEIESIVKSNISELIYLRTKFIRQVPNRGACATRNRLSLEACSSYILFLDDDAYLLDANSISISVNLMQKDDSIGAVALSQADDVGTILPSYMQPAPVKYDCYTQAFIGYGVILRRKLFIDLGGYREKIGIYGEEKEYCKRLLNHGFSTLYLPNAKVVHTHSPVERNRLTGLINSCRNSCFDALYNEPLLMCVVTIPLRILGFIRSHKAYCENYGLSDKGNVRRFLTELYTNFFGIWKERKPLKWSTYYKWTEIGKSWPPYNSNDL